MNRCPGGLLPDGDGRTWGFPSDGQLHPAGSHPHSLRVQRSVAEVVYN